jgi:energy-coupling factor transport system permease protein
VRRLTAALVLGGLVGVCIGVYGLLEGGPDIGGVAVLGIPMLIAGLAAAGCGFVIAGRRVRRSRYRPDPWRLPEWLVSGCGVVAGATLVIGANAGMAGLIAQYAPAVWPTLPLVAVAGILVGILPAWLAPVPASRVDVRSRPDEREQVAA